MSLLITSDIQAEWSNLDSCDKAWSEILGICKAQDIKTICNLGDGKQAYNPCDLRVTIWWQRAIRKAVKQGIRVIWLLGNHDRVGQYTDSDNWLPLLKRAGADTYDVPTIVDRGECRLFLLPYSTAKVAKRNIEKLLARKPSRKNDILLFHHDIRGCSYNNLGGKSDALLNSNDIKHDSFRYCIGGHIHKPQVFDRNVYYVGSPFCHDWGEVNQRKRYLILREGMEMYSIYSKIPGWLDPSILGFDACRPHNWKGFRVRVNTACDVTSDYGRRLEKSRIKAERKYKGAMVYIVPKFKESDTNEIQGISNEDSDERKIKAYIRETTRRDVGAVPGLAIDYMLEKLSHFSTGLRTGSKVKFIYAEGKNFLPFKSVRTDFTKKGITVIQGINEDRNGKSNGAAKTSLVQIIPVSMFGKTFKDQKSDKWANRWTDKVATATTMLRDSKGRKVEIVRGRRPPMLRMLVDGLDVSSGMKSNDKEGTQSQIEQVTSFTWQTLANAVYIDRSVSDAFLSGTGKQRTDVLSRFQNLERFEKALVLVKKDSSSNQQDLFEHRKRLAQVRGSIIECKESIDSLNVLSKVQIDGAYKEYLKRKKALKAYAPSIYKFNKLERKVKKIKRKYDGLVSKLRSSEQDMAVQKENILKAEREAIKWRKLKTQSKCPTCEQKVDSKWLEMSTKALYLNYNELRDAYELHKERITKLRHKVQLVDGEYTELQHTIGRIDTERKTLEGAKNTAQQQYMELASDTHASKSIINKRKAKLTELIAEKQHIKHAIHKYKRLSKLYSYASEAFSRHGIPAFLNRQLCPVLNKAAQYYADLFSDNEVQVQFKIVKGEFVPNIINVSGGENIEDQSTGERALAGLIASFALREVAPQTNVLILDEPGEGLDEQTARQFARALKVLKTRFDSIWVATHNVHILSELSGERTVTVVKKNKISKLFN
jgi:DNA repair exonuclease SbcCD ATPase subunit/DNA repair exonuclease SbcCD nuclease subunit